MATFDRQEDALDAAALAIREVAGEEAETGSAFASHAGKFVERHGPGPGWGADSGRPEWEVHGIVTSFRKSTPRATYWALRNDRLELFKQFMTTLRAFAASATSTAVVPVLGPFAGIIIPAGTIVAMFFSLPEAKWDGRKSPGPRRPHLCDGISHGWPSLPSEADAGQLGRRQLYQPYETGY